MTNFEKTQLTDLGVALVGKKGMAITFTRVETGCGIYTSGESAGNAKKLKVKVQDIPISSAARVNDVLANVKFSISNRELTDDYLLTEIGVYATDPDEGEILYAVCFATPENAQKIMAYNGIFSFAAIISLNMEISAGPEVHFETAGAYALAEDLVILQNEFEAMRQSISGTLRPMGTVAFENLPSLSEARVGYMYNISNQFTTPSSFKEGEGNVIPAGSNVYKTDDGYWDVLAGSPVATVNGQRGNVELTAGDVGALPLTGGMVKGNIDVEVETGEAQVNIKRGNRAGRLVVSSNENFGLYDVTNGQWMFKSSPEGKFIVYGADENGYKLTDKLNLVASRYAEGTRASVTFNPDIARMYQIGRAHV